MILRHYLTGVVFFIWRGPAAVVDFAVYGCHDMANYLWFHFLSYSFYFTVLFLFVISWSSFSFFHYIDTLLQVIATHTINAVYGVSLSLVLYILPYACYTSLLLPKSYGIVQPSLCCCSLSKSETVRQTVISVKLCVDAH